MNCLTRRFKSAGIGLLICGASIILGLHVKADTLTNLFSGTVTLDGDISDFFEADGVTLKPGVCLVNDSAGLAEPPVSAGASQDGQSHPSGFNQRRIMLAYNPNSDGGTIFIGVDLPGGAGMDSSSKTNHSLPGHANPNYNDGIVGFNGGGNGFGRGKIRPFDADGNGEADTIGRKADSSLLFRCPAGAGDVVDILNCGSALAGGATDNPRIPSGEAPGARENYVATLQFGNGQTVALEFFVDENTPAGMARVNVTAVPAPPAPFGARVSSSTGGEGTPLGFDVEFAVTNVNAAVPNLCDRLIQTLVVDSGSNRDGAGQGEDQNVLLCTYVLPEGVVITKNCPPGPVPPGGNLVFTGFITNTGLAPLTNITVLNDKPAPNTVVTNFPSLAPGEFKFFTGSYTVPLDSCPPYIDTVTVIATNICTLAAVTATNTASCPGTNSPGIAVSKSCPAGLIQPGETLAITGTVTNTGNITLTNVTVTNVIAALSQSRRILGPTNLPPGGVAAFTDSYVVPLDSCGPYRDTVVASGADKCFGRLVTASDFKDCPGTNSPGIAVSKSCPAGLVQPGEMLTITGTVTNTGNITLTNVTVTNVIAALSQSRLILGPTNLPPGGGASFTDSYTVPLDSCGPYPDTVVASGADKCFGRIVMATNSASCPGTNSPAIRVTKRCPTNPVAPGEISAFSGTVSNAGNITLTNVIVVNDQPTNNTLVLGPITLAPGQSTNFTGSYRIPLNCCVYVDTLKATGADKCFGRVVTNTATAVCTTLTTPALRVTKECPPGPVPLGQPLFFFGTVSNAGNITLTNVVVVNSQPSNNTPVLGPMTLAPGQIVGFMGSYIVPIDICDTNILDTLTARGNSICTGSNVTHSASSLCPIVTTPKLSLTKRCPPQPVPYGGLLVYSGTISNSGNVTITNVVVVNDKPTNNTPVLGPITLRPGESTNFTGSYLTCTLCCPPYVDTLTATGNNACTGSNVTARATASCPGITNPRITVTKECPPGPVPAGEPLFFSGVVSNEGDVALADVTVADDHAGMVGYIAALAPGDSFGYVGSYTPTNCGPNVVSTVTVSAIDICSGASISTNASAGCEVLCPPSQPPTILNPGMAGNLFHFSFATESNRTYRVQFTPSLSPIDWQTLTNFMGDGGLAIIQDTKTTTQRFYRVLMQ